MPTKQPRLNVVMDKELYAVIAARAKQKGVSMSMQARDMLRSAVEEKPNASAEAFIACLDRLPGTWGDMSESPEAYLRRIRKDRKIW